MYKIIWLFSFFLSYRRFKLVLGSFFGCLLQFTFSQLERLALAKAILSLLKLNGAKKPDGSSSTTALDYFGLTPSLLDAASLSSERLLASGTLRLTVTLKEKARYGLASNGLLSIIGHQLLLEHL